MIDAGLAGCGSPDASSASRVLLQANTVESFEPLALDASTHKVTFKYDYLGRRVQKTVYNWVDGQRQPGQVRPFLWSGRLLLEELDGSNNVVRKYTWGLDLEVVV